MAAITRRSLLAGAGGSLALPALARAAGADAPQVPAQRPNILFIMAEDLGYADVSCYGRPDFRTPNIDRLAAGGTRFLQAYAKSSVCSATRTALIGKGHLGFLPDYGPLKSGYETYHGFRGGAADDDRHDETLWNGDVLATENGYLTDLFGDHAIRTIEDEPRPASRARGAHGAAHALLALTQQGTEGGARRELEVSGIMDQTPQASKQVRPHL